MVVDTYLPYLLILELNPLAIKEATSYDLPVYLNKLHTYMDMYDSYKNIKYITI